MLPFDQPSELEEALPLYEGQLVNRYNHRAKTYQGYRGDNKYGMKPHLPEASDTDLANPTFEIEPRYWMRRGEVEDRLARLRKQEVLLAFRDVGAVWTNRRSAKGALLPLYPATHKLPVFFVGAVRAFEFTAVFNSSPFDFLLRGHLPGGSVALLWMLAQIPTPLPGTLDNRVAENAAKLSLTSYSVARLFNREPHPWNPEERYALDVEIDALVAHAYGLTRAQYEVVLDSFEVLARIETGKHGRYKFKEDCLAAYERLG